MITKPKLVYDATTPDDGDSVAAYLRTGSAALTSTTIGGKEALDVNLAGPLAVDVDMDGVYDAVDNELPDSVGVIAHGRAASPDETNQTLRTTAGDASSDAVVAANVHGLDVNSFGMGFNGTTWDRLLATSGALHVDIQNSGLSVAGNVADDAADEGNPIKVGSRAVSGALAAVSATGDRADAISDLYRRIWVNTAPNIGGSNAALAVDETVGGVDVFASPLAGRRKVIVQNNGSKAIALGFGTVTFAAGIKVPKGATWSDEIGPDIALKAISESGSVDCNVLQIA